MARRGRNRERDTIDIASPTVHYQTNTLRDLEQLVERSYWQELDDGREWHPEGKFRPAAAVDRADRAIVDVQRPYSRTVVGFANPNGVAVCVRRKTRREVLFAFNKARGRGGSARKRYTRNSSVKC